MTSKKLIRRVLALCAAAALLLTACGTPGPGSGDETSESGGALTWCTWGGYENHAPFFELLHEVYPDIELEFISYTGANRTGYSWAELRADDVPDIFITSQILDKELAKERLVDLSVYPFMEGLSTSVLDQTQIDGALYLLPVSYAMFGIYYNKTLMEEHGWQVPTNFAELTALCAEIEAEGLIPGVLGTQLTGNTFSAVFNLAKTDWLTTPEGLAWEKDFLAGNAAAAGRWEDTMDYVQQYIDIGMFYTDPEDLGNREILQDYLGTRRAVFCTMTHSAGSTELANGDELGLMPYISQDGSRNVYMYNPPFYFGISKHLTEPGNEKKLEDAVKVMSLIFSPEGQDALLGSVDATTLRVLESAVVEEGSILYDAQQAMGEGRVFPMTFAEWVNILSDVGQAYKEWFRGENGMDGGKCIARMDELQRDWLTHQNQVYFCESTADFTLEETGALVAQALGSAAGTDAVIVPLNVFHEGGVELWAGVSGKLYAGKINSEVANTLCPGPTGEYAVMTMTGAQAKELARAGLDSEGDSNPFPYLLVTRGDAELQDNKTYQVAFFMQGYTEEMAQTYSAQVREGSIRDFVRAYLTEAKTVSPGKNYWR